MASRLNRFFGGPPGWVLVRLILLSVVIGVIFSALGVHPFDIIDALERAVARIWAMGFDAVREGFYYFLLGAMVVFPVWVVMRLVRASRRSPPSSRD